MTSPNSDDCVHGPEIIGMRVGKRTVVGMRYAMVGRGKSIRRSRCVVRCDCGQEITMSRGDFMRDSRSACIRCKPRASRVAAYMALKSINKRLSEHERDAAANLYNSEQARMRQVTEELMSGVDDSDDRFIRLPEVMRLTGMSRSTIYLRIGEGNFPKPFHPSERMSVWSEREVMAWIRAVKATR
jgi:prophage regulatory protein